MNAVAAMLAALLITEAVECPVAGIWYRKWDAVLAVFLCNMLTNPLINLEMSLSVSLLGYRTAAYWCLLAVSEVAVVVTEGLILSKMLGRSRWSALLFSLTANGASYLTGVLLEVAGIL